MTNTTNHGFYEAAQRLGVSINTLRRAIAKGRIPAPPHRGATQPVPSTWVEGVERQLEETPDVLNRSREAKVPPYARYPGTSAWRKYPVRVRQYARFQALPPKTPAGAG